MKRPTLHDVAKEAGVSHMTVSRVVRGQRAVKAATAQIVREALRKTGYQPDPALSALAAYRSKEGGGQGSILAFLDSDGTPYSQIILTGIRQEAFLLGYGVETFPLKPGKREQSRLSRLLFHRGVRGLLFGPSDEPQEFAGWDWQEFAAVSLGALTHQPAMHAVAPDYFHAAMAACALLRRSGCRRPALVIDPRLEARTAHRWRGGYVAGLNADEKALVFPWRDSDASGWRKWIKKESVDGVLTIHSEVARDVESSRIKVIFLNDQAPYPGALRLRLNPRQIGAEGVRLLHHSLLRREFGLPGEPKMVALQGIFDR